MLAGRPQQLSRIIKAAMRGCMLTAFGDGAAGLAKLSAAVYMCSHQAQIPARGNIRLDYVTHPPGPPPPPQHIDHSQGRQQPQGCSRISVVSCRPHIWCHVHTHLVPLLQRIGHSCGSGACSQHICDHPPHHLIQHSCPCVALPRMGWQDWSRSAWGPRCRRCRAWRRSRSTSRRQASGWCS